VTVHGFLTTLGVAAVIAAATLALAGWWGGDNDEVDELAVYSAVAGVVLFVLAGFAWLAGS
jgi:hypothetical protein